MNDVMEALLAFDMNLCALGVDREGVNLEVSKDIFVELLQEAMKSRLATMPVSGRRPLRVPVRGRPDYANSESFRASWQTRTLDLSREMIADGLKVGMRTSVWQVRMKPADRADLLARWEAIQ